MPPAAQVGAAGGILGLLTSALGYWGKNSDTLKRHASSVMRVAGKHTLDLMATVVVASVLLGVILSINGALQNCEACGVSAQPPATTRAESYLHVLQTTHWWVALIGVSACLAFAWVVSALIGANTFSLHGMYGNRLVRAYLGAARARRSPHWFTGFDPEDNIDLAALAQDQVAPDKRRLFPVINIALNLVKPSTRRLSWQQRKACSFTATPLHCGADGVGFTKTAEYGAGGGMSLARAFTISGAAASPNMGYHSSPMVTLVMTLFNVRLGWWLPNPGPAGHKYWRRNGPSVGFWAMLSEALGTTTDDRPTVYLSDGGHFDNHGLYEMVRRRCHRIVLVDCTADPQFDYADLLSTVRKIRIDLGISIDLPSVLPGPERDTPHARMLVGTIRYSDRDGCAESENGTLHVLKPRLLGDEPPDVLHYAKASGTAKNSFPHQSTIDQFFDEDQFESYRMLGLLTAQRSFGNDHRLWPSGRASGHVDTTEGASPQ